MTLFSSNFINEIKGEAKNNVDLKRFYASSSKLVKEINGLKEFKAHLNSNPKVVVDFFAE